MSEDATTNNTPLTTASELSRLTVPQLKALCKERRITGYSKLGKAALLEKLRPAASGAEPSTPSSQSGLVLTQNTPSHSTSTQLSALVTSPLQNTSRGLGATTNHDAGYVDQGTSVYASSNSEQTLELNPGGVTVPSALASDLLSSSSGVTSPTSRESTKRPASTTNVSEHCTIPSAPAAKKRKIIPPPVPSIPTKFISSHAAPPPSSNGFRIPTVPKPKLQLAPFLIVSSTSNNARSIAQLDQAKSGATFLASLPRTTPKRFKPLTVSKSTRVNAPTSYALAIVSSRVESAKKCPLHLDQEPQPGNVSLYYLELRAAQDLMKPLTPITRPPSLSQRKLVNRWAIILSGLSDAERRACVQVSRGFRYAIYLSAGVILPRQHYAGRRFDQVKQQYPAPTINFWPYLHLRESEVQVRKASFDSSFLGSFYRGYEPISARLWTSPDHESQLVVALRFLLTRLWFTISLGGSSKQDPLAWLHETIIDAQPLIQNEIWTITAQQSPSSNQQSRLSTFYVLQSTCEVIGSPSCTSHSTFVHASDPDFLPASLSPESSTRVTNANEAFPIRADWSKYISSNVTLSSTSSSTAANGPSGLSLLSSLRWADHGEYEHGISRHWSKRTESMGEEGVALRIVAQRYVLACVVGNSFSGDWMSATQMAQEFAGLPDKLDPRHTSSERIKAKQIQASMFLPTHHHVESIHFTVRNNTALHPALAIVQTPGREYYILKDNGMQIGCEEDGVAEVWQRIVGCDVRGVETMCGERMDLDKLKEAWTARSGEE